MMRRAALLTIALCGALAAPALAHEGDPNYESLVTRIDGAAGVRAEMLNGDDRLLLINTTSETVTVEGYDGEPYARIKADGTVEVNQNSPATYLNDDRHADVTVPANATKDAPPRWRVEGRNGRFEFHDHRAHWMNEGTPQQVEDETRRTKVFDWEVPIAVGGRPAAVRGTLWWVGRGGGPPVAAFVGLGVLLVASAVLVVVVRRRRRRAEDEPGAEPAPVAEAW